MPPGSKEPGGIFTDNLLVYAQSVAYTTSTFMNLFSIAAISFFLLIPSLGMAQTTDTGFVRRLGELPAVPHPADPFVNILAYGGKDAWQYGFQSDGAMNDQQWTAAYTRLGHLGGYAMMSLGGWDQGVGRSIHIRAAQTMGRFTAGSLTFLPTAAQASLVRGYYRDPLALGMKGWLHDVELPMGTHGGTGNTRLRILNPNSGMRAAPSQDFDISTATGGLAGFRITFSFLGGTYLPYGGWVRLVGGGDMTNGWAVVLDSVYLVDSAVKFMTWRNGLASTVSSQRLPYPETKERWLPVTVTGQNVSGALQVSVAYASATVGAGTVLRPNNAASDLVLFGPIGGQADRSIDVDDLSISAGDGSILARYDFESGQAPPSTASFVSDRGGRGHNMTSSSGTIFWPTTGIDPTYASWLVDEVLAARIGLPGPMFMTNWLMSNTPGRVATWRRAGITIGSTEGYWVDPTLAADQSIVTVLAGKAANPSRWAAADGSLWNSLWVGNEKGPNLVPTPSDYKSLITLWALMGNRWFPVFTPMSNGHMGALNGTLTANQMAVANADALQAMCTAASWLQPDAAALSASTLDELVLGDARFGTGSVFVSRRGDGRYWFAGVLPAGTKQATVTLPSATGAIKNLATGQTLPVSNGAFTVTLSTTAEPWSFTPGAVFVPPQPPAAPRGLRLL